jgi:prephenate dehydrogenase
VIYGVGLLGGSLGMAVHRRGMAVTTVGLGRSLERLERARQLGAIDECSTNPAEALAGADALVLAIPPRQIREHWAMLAAKLEPGTFVTDVGSVKARLVEEAENVLPGHVRFIGSHPMAGSEKTGAEHGRSDFYEGSACLLTPTARTAPGTVELATRFWEALGARVIVLPPEMHDELLAGISHLPHLAAAALMQNLDRHLPSRTQLASICGAGLRDTTRIAASDPDIWKQILSENAPAVTLWLDRYIAILQEWRAALAKSTPDARALGLYYAEGSAARQALDSPEEMP